MKEIKFRRDFSEVPGPAKKNQGACSGESFCDLIVKEIEKNGSVTIILDTYVGIGSAFLREAFGGVARKLGEVDLTEKMKIDVGSNYFYLFDIDKYISEELEESDVKPRYAPS